MSAPRLQALTGARFVAAFVVVLYHLWRPAWDGSVVADVVAHGSMAVSFFFVLSGFVLGWSLSSSAVGPGDDVVVPATAFWRRRARRLLPMFAVSVVVALPVAIALARRAVQAAVDVGGVVPTVSSLLLPELLAHVTLVQAWVPGRELVINAPAWSLSAEVAFSLALPFVWRPLWRAAGKRPLLLLAALWLMSALPGVVYVVTDADGLARLGLPIDHRAHALWLDILRYHPLVRVPEFLAGVVVARTVRDGRLMVGRADVAVGGALAALLVGVVGLQVACGGASTVLTHNGLFLPVFAIVIAALASSTSSPSVVARLLSSRPLVVLGDASYALYLLHVPLLYWASGIAQRRGRPGLLDEPVAASFVVVVIIGLSVVAHRLVERPRRNENDPWQCRDCHRRCATPRDHPPLGTDPDRGGCASSQSRSREP